ncbi:MAG: type II toxin-antitoxin system HicB family antitoxin [Chloroflexota bacterium]
MSELISADKYYEPTTGRFVTLVCYVDKDAETGGYASRCPALEVASQGPSIEEAEDRIRKAVAMYLTAIDEDGELERIFSERGLRVAIDGEHMHTRARTAEGGSQLVESFPIEKAV